jgi:hypothetical protein
LLANVVPSSHARLRRRVARDVDLRRAPAREDIDLCARRRAPRPAVLRERRRGPALAYDLLRASYSRRPPAAGYDSFVSPVQVQIEDLAMALPDRGAAEALHALGFGTVLMEKAQLMAADRNRIYDAVSQQPADQRRMEQSAAPSS